ncbi:MAG: membrane dipeptidase, partial [Pseudomonadota bacterium]|nr:membrane dipeptidase [Pseudomonadota bacterium]
MHVIDCLQYCRWSETIFRQLREGGVDAVHVTIAYHETFRE